MKVNGIDIRKYDAKQLTVDVQPPPISVNYEWITGALLPIEFETNIKMGHLKLSVYFKGKNRNSIIRLASEFMANFKQSCDLELDGYKGKYKGFMTSNDYEKTIVKDRHILNLELDGFFYDDELEIVFDGKATATLYRVGSRDVPCIIEIYAKNNLINYTIKGFEENDIVIKTLEAGKTLVIDGISGFVVVDGVNEFDKVDLWEFPKLKEETRFTFSDIKAKVTIRYVPMWI